MNADPRMRGFARRSDVADVEALLESRVTTQLPSEDLATQHAAGRVLAGAVVSPIDLPPFDRSAMDGYAVRGEDTFGAEPFTPVRLRVIGQALPGRAFAGTVASGTAVRIMTGAPLPAGADAVLKVEDSRLLEELSEGQAGAVEVTAAVAPERNVSRRGEDVAASAELLPELRLLRPQDVAVALAAGIANVRVVRQPRFAVVTTGNELLAPGERPQDHRIVDTNGVMVAALLRRDGATAQLYERIPDDARALREVLSQVDGDGIIVCGGSSVGAEDHVPAVVRELGELPVHGIAMRPSSPTGVGFFDERPVFLLPGNPVSCLCAYDFFAGPTVRFLGGRSRPWPYVRRSLPLARKINSEGGRVDYARVIVKDGAVEPLLVSGASILSSTVRADGVVIVPRDAEGIEAGATVTVHLYGEAVS
ncbi:MAG: gephyrin-like molybdotransferase Glp [Planctomycetota bacterium]